jgi:hypothetical protein
MNVYHIIIILSVTALLGITLLTFVLNNKPRPMGLIAAKAIFALASVGTLYFYVGNQTMDMMHAPMAAAAFLSFAVIGGLYMFIRDKVMGDSNFPKWIAFAHGASAVTGYILLWIHAAGN